MAAELSEVRLTPAALGDLEDIWRYTADLWSEHQAERYVDGLATTFETLRAMPEIARERPEFRPPVRVHPSGEHVVVYHVKGDALEVIRVLGGRQNWRAVLARLR
ncbi:type II toxin-antitoxin system RelE/ParE family toxin [Sagittula sp. S175]|uniref:type II toxin-antitoxin system RelE/ParE family toxin n=1 Tax=Sagittula sp. S175 TaxID=3415129 RepID=UPI003C7C08A7